MCIRDRGIILIQLLMKKQHEQKTITLKDLDDDESEERFSDWFEMIGLLGQGAYGVVVSAVDNLSKEEVAVKIISKKTVKASEIDHLRSESTILSKLSHKNVVKFRYMRETSTKIFIVMDWLKGGNLKSYLQQRAKRRDQLSDVEASLIMKNLLEAVTHLHSKNIIHRDLKPENILFAKEGDLTSVKLIDFGLSTYFTTEETLTQKCGTITFMAPEVLLFGHYSKPVDIWSLGVIMFMLLNKGLHPFYVSSDTKQHYIEKLKDIHWIFPSNFSDSAKNLLLGMVDKDPERRLTAEQVYNHPWINRNHWFELSTKMSTASEESIKFVQLVKSVFFLALCKHANTTEESELLPEMVAYI
eukprot:TRINITY_DN8978_c0_g1_i3.p1 TRINITY_DN8978_c0_g1~~TRINITY_DN8978_c0_g1_i3.p1  ORF type:complete len:357 (+),score=48.53 TRINITY_DN8978_c0_g1_i3:64-1134(+)